MHTCMHAVCSDAEHVSMLLGLFQTLRSRDAKNLDRNQEKKPSVFDVQQPPTNVKLSLDIDAHDRHASTMDVMDFSKDAVGHNSTPPSPAAISAAVLHCACACARGSELSGGLSCLLPKYNESIFLDRVGFGCSVVDCGTCGCLFVWLFASNDFIKQ
ncbi:hypothetical protein BJ741DRAFT_355704 [Chytriomyces cf. hyalinus JEL632]|nr:hypothetical protein BJ741DRAFT_355704 [Chytriomyces cf. hyalinus JEL632]